MKIEGGFFENLKSAGGLAFGASFFWRLGEILADIFGRLIKWGIYALVAAWFGWYAGWSSKPKTSVAHKALAAQQAEGRKVLKAMSRSNPAIKRLLLEMQEKSKRETNHE